MQSVSKGKLCGLVPLRNTEQVTHFCTLISDILEHEDCFSPADLYFCRQHLFIFDKYGTDFNFTLFTLRWLQRLERQLAEVLDIPAYSDV